MQSGITSSWLAKEKLVLASRSKARIAMLSNAGIPIEIAPADIDERGTQDASPPGLALSGVALHLAEAKALKISALTPHLLVLGADQILGLEGYVLHKVNGRSEARKRLKLLSGRRHTLHSAYCFARNGSVLKSAVRCAEMAMRTLSDNFIDTYLDVAGPDVFSSVAVYEIEGLGAQMFDQISGDWFTIQGLPLFDVLAFLRDEGFLLG